MIRHASLDDAPAAARLLASVYADEVLSSRGLRHSWASVPARARRTPFAAEVGGELVGLAVASLLASTSEAGAAFARVTVHADHRHRGIGSALWQEVDARLQALGARHVAAEGLDDEEARRFMAARGFRVFSVEQTSGLDPRTLPAPPQPPAGVELRPFSAFADPRPIYELVVETARDIPTEHPIDDVRWEDWLEGAWELPDLDRDACLVALVDGEPAALTNVLLDPETGRALSSLTGTARRFRGRGLAYLVKHHALVLAAAKGASLAVTTNHDANRAMLAVNARLGYRPLARRATYARRQG